MNVDARHVQAVRSARIELKRAEGDGTSDNVLCEVTVALQPSGVARTRAIGGHAYAAINRAVERVRKLMTRGTAQRRRRETTKRRATPKRGL